jgi:predicted transcriptional regulator of viral defense system
VGLVLCGWNRKAPESRLTSSHKRSIMNNIRPRARHSGTSPTSQERVLQLVAQAGILRARELDGEGIPRVALTRLVRAGRLERVGLGLYSLPGVEVSEYHSFAEVQKRIPNGVICLLSALRFHEMTAQAPFEVWLTVHRKARRPRLDYPPVRVVRCSGEALTRGVESHRIEGVAVRMTSPARTVADCFLYRRKVGLEVALEALRDYRRLDKGTIDDLWAAAEFRRVGTVIRPYLEALA